MQAVGSVLNPQAAPRVIIAPPPPTSLTEYAPIMGRRPSRAGRIRAADLRLPREALNPYILAQDQYNTTIKAEGAAGHAIDVPWEAISAQSGSVTKVRSTGTVPIRGTDWWIYPGQQIGSWRR